MKRVLKTLFKLLATGTITLFIAACYGVVNVMNKLTLIARSPEGTGIRDLQVSLYQEPADLVSQETTDTEGKAVFMIDNLHPAMKAIVEDIDGPANGGPYKKAEIELDTRNEYTVEMTEE
jgi:hypothetical protein